MKKDLNRATIVYNPISTGFKEDDLIKIELELKKQGIKPDFRASYKAGSVIDIIKENDSKDNLIITLGGDGTVSEAYQAYNEINQQGLYAHIPIGTTNDMAKNYGVRYQDKELIVRDILNGEENLLDSFSVNGKIASYISTFGYLSHIPYVTSRPLKEKLGHRGYFIRGLYEMATKFPIKYDITYKTDNKCDNTSCYLGAVSNSIGFAGITLYPNADITDGMLELLLITSVNPKMIFDLLIKYTKDKINLKEYADYLVLDTSKEISLTFNNNFPKMPLDNDGENSLIVPNNENRTIIYKPEKKIKVLKRK